MIIAGRKNSKGYVTKIMIESISTNPDFQTADSWTMDVLSPGTDSIITSTGDTLGTVTTQIVVLPINTNQTLTFVLNKFDFYPQAQDQSISISENNIAKITPDLTCSPSGTASISFSIDNYMTTTAPTWVSVNSATGELTIATPNVTANTDFYFYINSAVSGFTAQVKKLIKLTVTKCTALN